MAKKKSKNKAKTVKKDPAVECVNEKSELIAETPVLCKYCEKIADECECGKVKHLPVDLVKRARKIGLVDEQIATYTDPATLKMACDNLKPQATAQPKFRRRPKAPMRIEGVPTKIDFETEISEIREKHVNRVVYDERLMNDFLRKQRIDTRSIQNVEIKRSYVGDCTGILRTIMVIEYLKKE